MKKNSIKVTRPSNSFGPLAQNWVAEEAIKSILRRPDKSGRETLRQIKERHPDSTIRFSAANALKKISAVKPRRIRPL